MIAVLTKEPVLLTFIGLALWRRDRRGAIFAGVPIVVLGVWYLYLRLRFGDSGQDVIEFGPPLVGIVDSVRLLWSHGEHGYALLSFVALVVLSAVGIARHRLGHPLMPALLLNLALVSLLSITPIGLTRNGTRSALPALVLALVLAATPAQAWRRAASTTSAEDGPRPVADPAGALAPD